MNPAMRQILESKHRFRRQVAERSFSEKLAILERLRERSLAIAASPLRERASRQRKAEITRN